jgi:hypothetical protein
MSMKRERTAYGFVSEIGSAGHQAREEQPNIPHSCWKILEVTTNEGVLIHTQRKQH